MSPVSRIMAADSIVAATVSTKSACSAKSVNRRVSGTKAGESAGKGCGWIAVAERCFQYETRAHRAQARVAPVPADQALEDRAGCIQVREIRGLRVGIGMAGTGAMAARASTRGTALQTTISACAEERAGRHWGAIAGRSPPFAGFGGGGGAGFLSASTPSCRGEPRQM